MRVLQLLSQTQPTGAESYALALSNWLTDHGHAVWIASDKLHSTARQPYVPLAVHEQKLKTRFKSTRALKQLIRENKIQVIHCHSRAAARLAYWATVGTKVAVVSTLHGRQPISLSKKLHDIFGDRCIAICENLQTQVTKTLGMNPRKIRLIRNPVLAENLPEIGPLPTETKLAWVGRFTGPKGERARQFLQLTAAKLLTENQNLHIHVIGGEPSLLGEPTLQLIAQLQKLHSNRLRVENYRANLDHELVNYNLVVAAGRVAIASLLSGVPTIALGEYSCEGLVTPKSLSKAFASNFGDIGNDGRPMSDVDFTSLLKDVQTALTSPLSLQERLEVREKVQAQFELNLVCQKIFNTYKSAYFQKQYSKNIPVLMYHKIPDDTLQSRHRIFVTKSQFEKHLQFFQSADFTTMHFQDLEPYRSGEKDFGSFPQKPLILTFDDGYVDNFTNAAPLLKQYGMKAVIYLLADSTLRDNSWDTGDDAEPSHPIMTLEQKRRLPEFGFEIGSHGFRHEKITTMNEPQMRHELQESKRTLEQDLNTKIVSFAYTYGITTARAAELAEEAGYSFAVNTDSGGLHFEENPFAIFRANVFPEDGPQQLRKKTASWYRRYFYLKRKR